MALHEFRQSKRKGFHRHHSVLDRIFDKFTNLRYSAPDMTAMPTSQLAQFARIDALAQRARSWMLEQAFPFWAERAFSPDGGFVERLDLGGNPIHGEVSRVRLQARMVYTFSLAAMLGWDQTRSRSLVEHGLACLDEDCRRDDGLFGRLVMPGRGLTDDTAEAYDTAFALLAYATAYRAFALPQALASGEALNHVIDNVLVRPADEGGFAEYLPAPIRREQNPHMHLTEASLAWHAATGDGTALQRAQSIAAFVQVRFFDAASGLLLEYDGGPRPENRTEAGHMFEWIWILGQMERASGLSQHATMAKFHKGAKGLLHGLDYLPLSQHCDGTIREAVQRTWGPTEKLKAECALWRTAPSRGLLGQLADTAEQLFADHVEAAVPGAWIDRIAPDRSPMVEDITPATGYHIFLALNELIDLANDLKS